MTDWQGSGRALGFYRRKIESGESPYEALARECREEIALEIVNAHIRTAVTHAYPDRTIHLTLIDCEPAPGAEPGALEHEALGWYTPGEMQSHNFCPADAELLPILFKDGQLEYPHFLRSEFALDPNFIG